MVWVCSGCVRLRYGHTWMVWVCSGCVRFRCSHTWMIWVCSGCVWLSYKSTWETWVFCFGHCGGNKLPGFSGRENSLPLTERNLSCHCIVSAAVAASFAFCCMVICDIILIFHWEWGAGIGSVGINQNCEGKIVLGDLLACWCLLNTVEFWQANALPYFWPGFYLVVPSACVLQSKPT